MEKDTVPFGITVGLITPLLGFALMIGLNYVLVQVDVQTKNGDVFQLSDRLVLMFAICLNLIPFQWAKKQRFDDMMRGLIFPTVALVIYWAYRFHF